MSRKEMGRIAERIAALYLELKGFTIVGANLRDGPREIDLVAERDHRVVFVEVKFRSSSRYGGFRFALSPRQKLDLERAAVSFLKATGRAGRPVRFDVIGLELEGDANLSVVHFPAAYQASGRYTL